MAKRISTVEELVSELRNEYGSTDGTSIATVLTRATKKVLSSFKMKEGIYDFRIIPADTPKSVYVEVLAETLQKRLDVIKAGKAETLQVSVLKSDGKSLYEEIGLSELTKKWVSVHEEMKKNTNIQEESEMTKTDNPVEELRSALESASTLEQARAVLNAATIKVLKEYAKEEGYYMPNFTNARKAEMVSMLSPTFEDDEPESETLTVEQLEQETGFKGYRRLGQEFLAGEESLEYLKNRIERIEKTLKYDANTAALRGLGYAFGISLEGKSCEELLSEIKEFVNNYQSEGESSEQVEQTENTPSKEFENLSTFDKLNGIIRGEYGRCELTPEIIENEFDEICRLLEISPSEVKNIYEDAYKNDWEAKEYFRKCVQRTLFTMQNEGEFITDKLKARINEVRAEFLSLVQAVKRLDTEVKKYAGLTLLLKEVREEYGKLIYEHMKSRNSGRKKIFKETTISEVI